MDSMDSIEKIEEKPSQERLNQYEFSKDIIHDADQQVARNKLFEGATKSKTTTRNPPQLQTQLLVQREQKQKEEEKHITKTGIDVLRSQEMQEMQKMMHSMAQELSLSKGRHEEVITNQAEIKDLSLTIKDTTADIKNSVNDIQNTARSVLDKCRNSKSPDDVMKCLYEVTRAFLMTIGKMMRLFYLLMQFIPSVINGTIGRIIWIGPPLAIGMIVLFWYLVFYYTVIVLTIMPGVSQKTGINALSVLYKGARSFGSQILTQIQNSSTNSNFDGPYTFFQKIVKETGVGDDANALKEFGNTMLGNKLSEVKDMAVNRVTDTIQNVSVLSYFNWRGGGSESEEIDEEIDTTKMIADEDNDVRSTELVNGIIIVGNLIESIIEYYMSIIEMVVDINLKSIKSGEPISDEVNRELATLLKIELPPVIRDTYAKSGINELLTMNNTIKLPLWVPSINLITNGGMKRHKAQHNRSNTNKTHKRDNKFKSHRIKKSNAIKKQTKRTKTKKKQTKRTKTKKKQTK